MYISYSIVVFWIYILNYLCALYVCVPILYIHGLLLKTDPVLIPCSRVHSNAPFHRCFCSVQFCRFCLRSCLLWIILYYFIYVNVNRSLVPQKWYWYIVYVTEKLLPVTICIHVCRVCREHYRIYSKTVLYITSGFCFNMFLLYTVNLLLDVWPVDITSPFCNRGCTYFCLLSYVWQ